MKLQKHSLVLMIAAGLLAAAALAQTTPNFSGTWVFNAASGKNLGMMSAMQITLNISQTPAALKIKESSAFQGKESSREITYDLAGKPVMNEGAMGGTAETVANWTDGKLVVTWTSEGAVAGTKTVRTETRSLSADGNMMSVEQVRGTNPPMVMVFEKKK
jgi:hypothetical protein